MSTASSQAAGSRTTCAPARAAGSGRWLVFVRERFHPLSHLPMIALFVAAHLIAAFYGAATTDEALGALWPLSSGLGRVALLGVAALFFFLKLRFYDEIKDYEVDLVHNPTRPLARGLVTHRDLYRGIVTCIGVELVTASLLGPGALSAMAVAIAYSLLMYREFFIGKWLRRHLTTYAVTHTVVSTFLSVAILCGLLGRFPWELDRAHLLFALNSWFLFNIFEFGRKTFASSEERAGIESYSSLFGRTGAVGLVAVMALVSHWLFGPVLPYSTDPEVTLGALRFSHVYGVMAATAGALIASGAVFAVTDRRSAAKAYRAASSAYILLIYLEFTLAPVLFLSSY